ncbi:hypothetical protein BT96DRAFT_1042907 [Gymnopus androsaceus JB14]|uniref:Postreplication repair E3 ubiquitin-protein ligase RAD18 n=1 Tax=Gymnopus androsaceus JB14 TaxID=1447944 RepID=A0A6A4HF08_9AGAR|nr:hypothetical protein BT96DRAFT_1042907 [Gymnopus androsaceus JB14]
MAGKNQIQKLMAEVQDPSDFPEHSKSPGLRLLDSALRCTICSELYDGPVTLKCGHCFCSLCIRQSLAEKQECPACREEEVSEGHLRRNTVMEEAVTAWKACRPYILQVLKDVAQHDVASSRPSKKRRLDEDLYEQDVACSSPEGAKHPPAVKQTGSPHPDELVDCPVCSKRVKYKIINEHMDEGCTSEPEPDFSSKAQWENLLGSKSLLGKKKKKGKERALSEEKDDPLPKKSYDTLRDKAIKALLQEHDLSTTGSRQMLIARHQRWVSIYNANLDKAEKLRKSLPSLRRDLEQWETQQKNKTKRPVVDSDTYQIKQKSEFDKLVEAARPKKPSSAIQTTSGEMSAAPAHVPRSRTISPSLAEKAIVVDDFEDERMEN